jgi:hypothetical protein
MEHARCPQIHLYARLFLAFSMHRTWLDRSAPFGLEERQEMVEGNLYITKVSTPRAPSVKPNTRISTAKTSPKSTKKSENYETLMTCVKIDTRNALKIEKLKTKILQSKIAKIADRKKKNVGKIVPNLVARTQLKCSSGFAAKRLAELHSQLHATSAQPAAQPAGCTGMGLGVKVEERLFDCL